LHIILFFGRTSKTWQAIVINFKQVKVYASSLLPFNVIMASRTPAAHQLRGFHKLALPTV